MIDYKSALQKSADQWAKNEEENQGEANKVAVSKAKTENANNAENVLNQPKVEEIEAPKENLPVDNFNDNAQPAIQQSTMPAPAPAVKSLPRLAPPQEAIPAPIPATPAPMPATPEPAPYSPPPPPSGRLIPAPANSNFEPGNPDSSNKRLYPYQQ